MLPTWDQPPVNMPMPPELERITTIFFIAAATLITAGTVVLALRRRTLVYPMLVLGGALCTFNEPALNIPAKIWHARSDNFPLLEEFGRPMPLWVPFGYLMFFSALPVILLVLLERGAGYRRVWQAMAAFWVLDTITEVILTGDGGMYTYYGYQPFAIGDFCSGQLVTNGTGITLIAVILHRAPWMFRGARALLAIPLVPVMQFAALAVAAPGFWAMNSDAGHVWQWVGMAAALVIGVFVIDVLLRLGTATPLLGAPHTHRSPAAPSQTDAVLSHHA